VPLGDTPDTKQPHCPIQTLWRLHRKNGRGTDREGVDKQEALVPNNLEFGKLAPLATHSKLAVVRREDSFLSLLFPFGQNDTMDRLEKSMKRGTILWAGETGPQ
jgi:hypothetical protein